jgi:hypothetical protein
MGFGMSIFGSKAPMLDRDTAMNGLPLKLPAKRVEEKNGRLYVTIEFRRPRWQQLLGADEVCERTFGLDAYGREVFDACDGGTSVMQIVKRFARNHKISVAEAEVSVSTFLKTLMSRGMVGIELEKK